MRLLQLLSFIVFTFSGLSSLAQIAFQRAVQPIVNGCLVYGLTETADHGYVVGGYTNVLPGGDRDQFLTKMDSIGHVEWTRAIELGFDMNDAVNSFAALPNGEIVVGSYHYGSQGYLHRMASDGTLNLSRAVPFYPRSMLLHNEDTIIMAGMNLNVSGFGFAAFDLDFNLLWEKHMGSFDGEAIDVIHTSDNGILVTGWAANQLSSMNAAIIVTKADASGNVIWNRIIGSSPGFISSYDGGTVQTSDGGYVVCFKKINSAIPVLIKLDGDGNIVWSKSYGSNLYMHDITLDDDGNPLISAQTTTDGVGVILFSVDHTNGNVIETYKYNNPNYNEGIVGFQLINNSKNEVVFCSDIDESTVSESYGYDGFVIGNILPGSELLCNAQIATIAVNNVSTTTGTTVIYTSSTTNIQDVEFETTSYESLESTWCESFPMMVTVTTDNVSCYGLCDGEAAVEITGGAEPYAILWSNGHTESVVHDLCEGEYSVTITDLNGNEQTIEFMITEPNQINVMIDSSNDSVCAGECITLMAMVSGADSPLTFNWQPMQQVEPEFEFCPTENTLVNLIVSDSLNCTGEAQLLIHFHELPAVTLESSSESVCSGECVTLTANVTGEAIDYNFTWSPELPSVSQVEFCPEENTIVHVIVTDSLNCASESQFQIDFYELPVVTLELSPDSVCVIASFQALSGGSPSNGIYSGEGIVDGSIFPASLNVGIHEVTYMFIDEFGCIGYDTDEIIVWECPDGINDQFNVPLSIWPNPASEVLHFSNNEIITSIQVSDVTGKIWMTIQPMQTQANVSLMDLPSGVYFTQVACGQELKTSVFTKQ